MGKTFREIMNVRLSAGSRTLYLDLAENENGTKFLSISEVRASESDKRSRILLDEQYIPDLHRALAAVLELLDFKSSHKKYSIEEKRRGHARAYEPWTAEEESNLRMGYSQGRGVNELAEQHGRAPTAIISRLYQLGILKSTQKPRWD